MKNRFSLPTPHQTRAKSRGRDGAPKQQPAQRESSRRDTKTRTPSTPTRHQTRAKSRGRDGSTRTSPTLQKQQPSPSHSKSRGKGIRTTRHDSTTKRHEQPPSSSSSSQPNLIDDLIQTERLLNFDASAAVKLEPVALGNKWLDLVDTYVMPTVKNYGFFSDDTTCHTGVTGWETVLETNNNHTQADITKVKAASPIVTDKSPPSKAYVPPVVAVATSPKHDNNMTLERKCQERKGKPSNVKREPTVIPKRSNKSNNRQQNKWVSKPSNVKREQREQTTVIPKRSSKSNNRQQSKTALMPITIVEGRDDDEQTIDL